MSKQSNQYFEFLDWQFSTDSGLLQLNYFDSQYGDFTEQFVFPQVSKLRYEQIKQGLETAINCLHWMAGVSYFKTSLAREIRCAKHIPSDEQAKWLTQTWQSGLAELAYENNLPWLDYIAFPKHPMPSQHLKVDLKPRSLVAIGGGKDSMVSIEMLKGLSEEMSLFMVGQSTFIKSVANRTALPLMQVKRTVDSRLKAANDKGAYNGHVPITAINSCVAVVTALICDYDSVVFSNERSADVGNVKDHQGRWVNHQYSKSFEFEQAWQSIIKCDIALNLNYFSILRPFSELAIVKKFAHLKQYFPYFSSCNRNFHLSGSKNQDNHWCGECAKCAFVFLCLSPFVSRDELVSIFRKNLFADQELNELFSALLGIKGLKPFECVGEAQECRTALRMVSQHPDWLGDKDITNWIEQIEGFDDGESDKIFQINRLHQIPEIRNFIQALTYEFA